MIAKISSPACLTAALGYNFKKVEKREFDVRKGAKRGGNQEKGLYLNALKTKNKPDNDFHQ